MKRLAGACAVAVMAAAAAWAPATAEAASAYRYWQYWKVAPGSTQWAFSQVGPSTRPADGSVEGWRFGVSATGGDDKPRMPAAGLFEAICGAGNADAGKKRVAVVVDFGATADAPSGETPPASILKSCETVDTGATGIQILGRVVSVRTCTSGLIGGLDGYPRTECGAVVDAKPTPSPQPPATSAPQPSSPGGPSSSRPPSGAAQPSETVRAGASSGADSATDGRLTPTAEPTGGAAVPGAATPDADASTPAATGARDTGTGSSDSAADASAVAQATDSGPDQDTGSPIGLLVTGAILSALAGAAFVARRS